MSCSGQQFKTSPRTTPATTERVQLLPSRTKYSKAPLKVSSYWITINKIALTAKSKIAVNGTNFDANDSNTKQHWLILTEEELASFDDLHWTGIETPTSETGNEDGAWYDLNGRRLSIQPNQKGVYIYNGKKILF